MKKFLRYGIKPIPYVISGLSRKIVDADNVCILAFKFLGDAVFSIPAIKVITENFSGKRIILFCYEDTRAVYQLILRNVEFVTFKREELNFNSRIPRINLIHKIRKTHAGILFDLTSEYQTALATAFSGAAETVGFNSEYFEYVYKVFSLKRKLPDLTDMHLEPVLKFFNIKGVENRKIFKKDFDVRDRILVHPFAGWKAKEWNITNFINLAAELNKEYTCQFITRKNCIPYEPLSQIKQKGIGVVETEGVDQLIEELKTCSMIISNDTGPVYVAALLGKATFTIYGPTNPLFTVPRGGHHDYIIEKIECSSANDEKYCSAYGGRLCGRFECMDKLDYENVTARIKTFAERIGLQKVKLGNSYG